MFTGSAGSQQRRRSTAHSEKHPQWEALTPVTSMVFFNNDAFRGVPSVARALMPFALRGVPLAGALIPLTGSAGYFSGEGSHTIAGSVRF